MKKLWFKIRLRYAQFIQWFSRKRMKDDDKDNIYPFW